MNLRQIKYLLNVLMIVATLNGHATADTASYPYWMNEAVIYGIKPSSFVKGGSYDGITRKIPELKYLGINTIWLQPVYKSSQGGQGYDVTDFFSLRNDLGSAEQLKHLIAVAKSNRIRVLFDFVPNHTSIDHPYASDCIEKGRESVYYDYYQHENDGAPYSSFYHRDAKGFIYYFWTSLVNLNYNNEQVQRMIIDACKYWVKEYDIDGYRFDAVWAVNARAPDFGKRLRAELKLLKPDILLLAEDKGCNGDVYDKGFDAAYDWTADTSWVSQWSWQYEHHAKKNMTVFNHPDVSKRKSLLSESIFSNGKYNIRLLRFLENNDTQRFIAGHSIAQTKMAAGILFSLPGIPMIFCGQEIGFRGHPYSRQAIFDSTTSIRQQDSFGLFTFYRNLILERSDHIELRSSTIEEIPVVSSSVIAYRRGTANKNIIVVANLDSTIAQVAIPGQFLVKGGYTDLLNGKHIRLSGKRRLQVQGYTTLWLIPKKIRKKESGKAYLKNM